MRCRECGELMMITNNGIAHHLDEDGGIDYDADADHTAIAEVVSPVMDREVFQEFPDVLDHCGIEMKGHSEPRLNIQLLAAVAYQCITIPVNCTEETQERGMDWLAKLYSYSHFGISTEPSDVNDWRTHLEAGYDFLSGIDVPQAMFEDYPEVSRFFDVGNGVVYAYTPQSFDFIPDEKIERLINDGLDIIEDVNTSVAEVLRKVEAEIF